MQQQHMGTILLPGYGTISYIEMQFTIPIFDHFLIRIMLFYIKIEQL